MMASVLISDSEVCTEAAVVIGIFCYYEFHCHMLSLLSEHRDTRSVYPGSSVKSISTLSVYDEAIYDKAIYGKAII